MQVTPYVFFNGNCADALAFYESALGAEITMKMLASDMPPDPNFVIPDDKKGLIMHSQMKIGEGEVMMSDNLMGESADMDGASIMLNLATAAEAKSIFDNLADGAEITMAWEPTFWSAGFGSLRDKFGVRWMVGTDEPPAEG